MPSTQNAGRRHPTTTPRSPTSVSRAHVCLALSLPVIAVAMNVFWQFRYWQWVSLVLATPVVFWGGCGSTRRRGGTCGTGR